MFNILRQWLIPSTELTPGSSRKVDAEIIRKSRVKNVEGLKYFYYISIVSWSGVELNLFCVDWPFMESYHTKIERRDKYGRTCLDLSAFALLRCAACVLYIASGTVTATCLEMLSLAWKNARSARHSVKTHDHRRWRQRADRVYVDEWLMNRSNVCVVLMLAWGSGRASRTTSIDIRMVALAS